MRDGSSYLVGSGRIGREDMDLEKKLNTLLVTIFQDLMDIEQKALITGEFRDSTWNDMHVS